MRVGKVGINKFRQINICGRGFRNQKFLYADQCEKRESSIEVQNFLK